MFFVRRTNVTNIARKAQFYNRFIASTLVQNIPRIIIFYLIGAFFAKGGEFCQFSRVNIFGIFHYRASFTITAV